MCSLEYLLSNNSLKSYLYQCVLVKVIVQYYWYLLNPLTQSVLENTIYQVSHKLQILYFLEMASSLLSQFLNSLPTCFFDKLSGSFGGGLAWWCQVWLEASHFLEFPLLILAILNSISSLMTIGLDAEVPCLESKRGRAFLLTPALP